MAGTSSNHGAAAPTARAAWLPGAAGAVLVGLLFAALVSATWVGFLESDDLEYAEAAAQWRDAFPHLGASHWALRHFIVLPVAAVFALFGTGEMALGLPTLIYAAGTVALTGLCVRQAAGTLAGVIAALLVTSLPVVIGGASTVFADTVEAFFVLASLWAYWFAARSSRAGLFLLSGALAGCAFITRETSVALLVLYLVLFLLAPRRFLDFARMGAGFVMVVGLDWALLWAASGDPLWRFHASGRGVAGDNPALPQFQMNVGGIDRHGVIVAPRALSALLAVFVNQNMGLLAWAAVPAAIALARRPGAGPARSAALHFAGLAAAWFVVLSYVMLFVWIIPRYQTVTMVALCVPLAIWLANRFEAGRLRAGARLLPAAILLTVVGSGVALSLLANRELMFGERGLVAFARIAPGPIRTDPATLRGADWLLRAEGLRDRVSAGPCAPGGLCYINPLPRRSLPADWVSPTVPPGATVLLETVRRPSALGALLDRTGVLALMPGIVGTKLAPASLVARGVRMPG